MVVKIARVQGKLSPSVDLQLGSAVFTFRRGELTDGTAAMIAEVDDATPAGRAAVEQVRGSSGRFVVVDADAAKVHAAPQKARTGGRVDPAQLARRREEESRRLAEAEGKPLAPETPTDAGSAVPKARNPVEACTLMALRNGWLSSDLPDCAVDPLGLYLTLEHTRSEVSGLSLPELATAACPEGWAAHRGQGTAWPWELPGFRGPSGAWKPPGVGPRLRAVAGEPDDKPAPKKAEPGAPVSPPAGEDANRKAPAAEDDGAPEDDGGVPEDGFSDTDATFLQAHYSEDPDQWEAAVELYLGAWHESGEPPTRQKMAHRLKKGGQPVANDNVHDVFLKYARARVS